MIESDNVLVQYGWIYIVIQYLFKDLNGRGGGGTSMTVFVVAKTVDIEGIDDGDKNVNVIIQWLLNSFPCSFWIVL